MTGRLLSAAVLLSLLVLSMASRGVTSEPPLVPDHLQAEAAAHGTVRVIVRLNAPFVPEGQLASPAHVMGQRQMLAGIQSTVRSHLRGVRHRIVREFGGNLPLMAIEASPDALRMLASLRGIVADVQEDELSAPSLAQSVPLINGDDVWGLGFDGTNQIVAILDTGVQKDHEFFSAGGGKVIAEACFSSNNAGFGSTSVCPGGVETVLGAGSAGPCTGGGSGCDHGTHVAGIAAGSGPSFSGVAKGASIIAIQVFSRFTDVINCGGAPPCVLSFTSDQIEALNYVHAQRQIFPGKRIAAVNMSLGGGQFFSVCDVTQPYKPAVDQLRTPSASDPTDAGVATVIAAGNSFFTDSISAPACTSSAIPVASSTKADVISSFSNMASPSNFPSLLVAPGSSIQSSVPPGPATYAFFSGTSMAAPHVAGTFAVLREAAPTATVDQILTALKGSGKPITDTRSTCSTCASGGFTVPRIDVLAAAGLLLPNLVVQTLTAPSAGMPGANVSVSTSIRNVSVRSSGASNLKLYLATDAVVTTNDTLLGTIAFNGVNGGATSPVKTLSVQIPSAATPGARFIRAVADADSQVDETSEADNGKTVPIQIVLPDLTVPSVTFAPAASGPGANISVTHTVRNIALGPAAAPASISGIYLSLNQSFSSRIGGPIATVSVPAVAAGATTAGVTAGNVNIPGLTPPGKYYVLVRANDASGFVEDASAPDNNSGSSGTQIVVGPDLLVTAGSTVAGVSAGGNASVTYTIRNQGGQAAGAFDIGFALMPQPSGTPLPIGPTRPIPTLAAGAMPTLTDVLSIPPGTPPGPYKVQITMDSGGTVGEADEGNNTFLTGVINVAQADLTVSSVTFAPAATLPGGNVTVTHIVRNVALLPGGASRSFSRLLLSRTQSIINPDVDFGLGSVPPVPAAGTTSVTRKVQIPGNTAPGLYYIGANADDPNTIVELDEGNNQRFSITRLIVGADVLVAAASTATGVAPGMNVSVMYTLKNRGGQASNVGVIFSLIPQPSGPPISLGPSRPAATLAAGASTALANAVTIPGDTPPGAYRISVLADASSDADPSNNTLLAGIINVARADLVVPFVTFSPVASLPGGKVTVTHTVRNQAPAPGRSGATSTRLWLSLNQSVSGQVADLGLVSAPALNPGATATVSKSVQIPSLFTAGPGLYYVLAAADDPGAATEVDESNNIGVSSKRIIIGADILPTLATTPASATPGTNLRVNYTLKNQGGAASGPFDVTFAIVPVNVTGIPSGPDVLLGLDQTVSSILPGASVMRTGTVVVPSVSGLHRIRIMVDPGAALGEADRANNTLLTAGTLNVVKPDLVVPSVTFTPAASTSGGAFTVMYSVKNQAIAPGNAGQSSSRLFLSRNQSAAGELTDLGAVSVPPMAAGTTVSGTRRGTIPLSTPPGRYYFGIQADPTGVVDESSEGNNVGFSQTAIILGPDIAPIAATTLAGVAPGKNVSVTFTLRNRGGEATGSFDVGFTLVPQPSGTDIPIGPIKGPVSLAAGVTTPFSQTVLIPADTPPGLYKLRVSADVNSAVAEADESNNTILTGVLNVVRPDLAVQAVTATPGLLAVGANISVTQTIKNVSPSPGAAPATTARLYLSDDPSPVGATSKPLIGDVSIPPIAAGAVVTVAKSFPLPAGTVPGKYWIYAQANAVNPILEGGLPQQDNNLQRTATSIVVGADLTLTTLTVPPLAAPNLAFPVVMTVKNQGGQTANASVVRFFLSPTGALDGSEVAVGVTSTAAIVPGASATTTTRLTLPGNTSAGAKFLLGRADADDQVVEADESNNILFKSFTVQLPNIQIVSVTPPAAVIRGRAPGAPTASVVVKNLGPGPSAPFDVQVFANRDDGTPGSGVAGTGDLLFRKTVASLAPNAIATVSGPVVVPETVSASVRLAGNYWVSAVADATGSATSDPALGDNAAVASKKLPVLPDMTKLSSAAVALTLLPQCLIPGDTLDLTGPASFTSQSVANPSTFSGTVTLNDPSVPFSVKYTITGTVRAVDSGGNPGVIASSFTYVGGGASGAGTISGAAPGLSFTGGSIIGHQTTPASACTFNGAVDIVRSP